VDVQTKYSVSSTQEDEIRHQLSSSLRLDEDLTDFYRIARRHAQFQWIPRLKAGRLLRAPTVFEDIVKMICTTNCTWALTTVMVQNLTAKLGEKFNDHAHSFPTPERLAGVTERLMRKEIRTGYRSPYLLELAERVASGKLDLESWRTSTLPTDRLYKEVRAVKGVGDYAAGNILKLLGRYDYLGLDSWVRAQFYKLYRNGRKVGDRTIERLFAPYGRWRGLFFWLDMTRDWYTKNIPF
jgi:N-glycosylase/DNA lyase